MNLTWNVFYHDFNKGKIIKFNIFDHGGFKKEVQDHLQKCKTLQEFEKELSTSLMYYFWAKCEYEIIIGPWIGSAKEVKIDIYTQVRLNWEIFRDYVWNSRKE